MERYILKYLRDIESQEQYKKTIDKLKVELDWHFYAYGDNLENRYKRGYKGTLRDRLAAMLQNKMAMSKIPSSSSQNNIITFARLPIEEMGKEYISLYSTIFSPIGKRNIIGNGDMKNYHMFMNNVFNDLAFNQILKLNVLDEILRHEERLLDFYKKSNVHGLFLNTDEYYYNKVHIDIFKGLNRPSFIFSHGLPGIYSKEVDNKSDYLVVWGQQIKDNYISVGFDPNKIIVGGNPNYRMIKVKQLRNDLSNVLVMTSGSIQWHMHSWTDLPIYDRSLIVLYLYSVENVLKKVGVKRARLRPHPSVSAKWLSQYVDIDFYTFDKTPFVESINRSSLIIGCTSTTYFESLMHGVNYIVYEPTFDGYTMTGGKLVPPFDGSDNDVVIANNEERLYLLIKERYSPNIRILENYMEPFNAKKIKDIIHNL